MLTFYVTCICVSHGNQHTKQKGMTSVWQAITITEFTCSTQTIDFHKKISTHILFSLMYQITSNQSRDNWRMSSFFSLEICTVSSYFETHSKIKQWTFSWIGKWFTFFYINIGGILVNMFCNVLAAYTNTHTTTTTHTNSKQYLSQLLNNTN